MNEQEKKIREAAVLLEEALNMNGIQFNVSVEWIDGGSASGPWIVHNLRVERMENPVIYP